MKFCLKTWVKQVGINVEGPNTVVLLLLLSYLLQLLLSYFQCLPVIGFFAVVKQFIK
jgi:hypothetical protein